jgi:hypothetical protein
MVHPADAAPALSRHTRACGIYQDPAHYLGADSEEMRSILPIDCRGIYQSKICLMYERGRLESVIRPLSIHSAAAQAAQFRINQGR